MQIQRRQQATSKAGILQPKSAVRLQQATGQRSTRQSSINTAHQKHHRLVGRGSPLRSGSSKGQGITSDPNST
ncbi:hypothetical protein ACLOJK_006585 [Asimina triloba]